MSLGSFVIGSSVESAYFALVNEMFFIPTRKMPPMFYNTLDVSILGKTNESESWPYLNLMIGLLSKRIAFAEESSIRVTEELIRITTGSTTFKYLFDKLYIFDSTGVQIENEILLAKDKTFLVLDDFELSSLGRRRQEIPAAFSDAGFAKKIHFYSSDRVDGANYITDCVVESELTQDEINSFEYSDSMVRFAVERHLESVNVFGILMKLYDSGKPKYRKPKVVHVKRLVFEKDNNCYKDSEKIKFVNLSLREIIEKSTKG